MNSTPFIFKEALAVWRVFLPIVIAQILGGLVGFLLHHSADTFMNIWSGGAFATSMGLLVGLSWHYKNPDRRTSKHRLVLSILVFNSLAMLLITLFAPVGPGHI